MNERIKNLEISKEANFITTRKERMKQALIYFQGKVFFLEKVIYLYDDTVGDVGEEIPVVCTWLVISRYDDRQMPYSLEVLAIPVLDTARNPLSTEDDYKSFVL